MQVLIILAPNLIQAAMYWLVSPRLPACPQALPAGQPVSTPEAMPALCCTWSLLSASRCRPDQPLSAFLPSSCLQVGLVLSFSPDLVRGRKMLRGWVITTTFACADLFAIM